MKNAFAAVVTSVALLTGIPSASAAVTVIATVSSESINVGDTVQLDLQLNLGADFGGYFNPAFVGGGVTLFSGDGQQKTFFFGPGGTTEDFIWDVTYATAGNFTPSYVGLVSYFEKFKEFDGYSCKYGHSYCQPKYDIEKVVRLQFLHGDFTDPAVGDSVVNVAAAAPELSTWAMLLIGFACLGFAGYRRARKGAEVALAA